ncbi:hypothetical protein EOD42_08965 [Rhodovarius crocodyli]|uniref:Uncharacterized protein n=1 Tax=Rhodovarius crocodyli TaxID=1979269 RepID=A0A437MJS9_9PROT|nr:hypothetical protein [Rhodovarius crocodyli]RVT97910.1 hypothetical protein EOD42_08965 [Rhodovarius crocodyli]
MTALPLPLFDDPAQPAPSIQLPAGLPEGSRPRAAGVSSRINSPGAPRPGAFSAEDIAARLRSRTTQLLASAIDGDRQVASILLAGGQLVIDDVHEVVGRWPGISILLRRQCWAMHCPPRTVARMCGEPL